MEGNMLNDSHLFSTSRQVNLTVRERERKKNLKIAPLTSIMYACAAFAPPYEKKGTHEGRFITRHVSPMCCSNRNRS